MTSIGVSIIFINAIIFSFIFWILTFISKALYSNKYFSYKLNFYECGFKSLSLTRVSYNINYILLILFLLIYDGEFLILIPFALNLSLTTIIIVVSVAIFILWLIIALIFDYAFNALDWQV